MNASPSESSPSALALPAALAVALGACVVTLAKGWVLGAPHFAWLYPFSAAGAGEAVLSVLLAALTAALSICIGTAVQYRTFSVDGLWTRGALAFLLGQPVLAVSKAAASLLLPLFIVDAVVLMAGAAAAVALLWRARAVGASPRTMMPAPMQWFAAVALAYTLSMSLSPVVQSDGLRYHFFAAQYWSHAGFVFIPENAFTNLPLQLSLLSTPLAGAMPFPRTIQVLHAMNFVALVVVAGALAAVLVSTRAGEDEANAAHRRRWARGAAQLLVATVPVLAIVAAWPFSDVASAAPVLAALLVALLARDNGTNPTKATIAIGLLLGSAAATKLSAMPACLAVGVLSVLLVRRSFVLLVLLGAVATVPLAPWLVKNFVHTGNVLFPFVDTLPGGQAWPAETKAFYAAKAAEKGVGTAPLALLTLPWLVATDWLRFEEQQPGPAFLAMFALLPVALLARRRASLVAVAAMVLYLLWAFGYQSIRFLLVPFVLSIVCGAATLAALVPRHRNAVSGAVAALALTGFAWTMHWSLFSYQPAPALAAVQDPQQVVAARFNAYPAVLWLNEATKDDSFPPPVLYIGEHRGAYAQNFRPLHSDWFDIPRFIAEWRRIGADSQTEFFDRLHREGVAYALVNVAELAMYADRYVRPRVAEAEYDALLAAIEYLRNFRVFGDDWLFVAKLAPSGLLEYREAAELAAKGEHDRAIIALRDAVSLGFWGRDFLRKDLRFDAMRDHPEFAELRGRIEAQYTREASRCPGFAIDSFALQPGSEFQSSDRSAVLLLHGYGSAPTAMRGAFLRSPKFGISSLHTAPDPPGPIRNIAIPGNEAIMPEWRAWNFANSAEALRYVRRFLPRVDRATLVGFSQGGVWAAQLAAENPDLFSNVVVFSPGEVPAAAWQAKPSAKPRTLVIVTGRREEEVYRVAAEELARRWAGLGPIVRMEHEGGHELPPVAVVEAAYREALR